MDLDAIKVTDKKRIIFEAMGINQVEDLLTHYPFRYNEFITKPINEWEINEEVCFEGIIASVPKVSRYGYRKSVTRFKVIYDEEEIDLVLFNRPWTNGLTFNKRISVFGKYDGHNKVVVSTYNSQPLKEQLGIIPVYSVKDKLNQKDLRKYINRSLALIHLESFIPDCLKNKYHLIDENKAINEIHNPTSKNNLKEAIKTLKYLEFFKFQLKIQYIKSENSVLKKAKKVFDENKINTFLNNLPFSLTKGQTSAINDILNDLKSEKVMYRLVQGDVGCGKTLVSVAGMYASVLSGYQAALMAPTEILAKQHYQNIKNLLAGLNVKVELLYSSLSTSDKNQVLNDLNDGTCDLIIGTHALFQKSVTFKKLGIVISDEQHRFGVNQRKELVNKGEDVDFLLMSATPIPRTLATSLYGDMDVSSISDLPKGKKPIITKVIHENSLRTIMDHMTSLIDQGGQVYIVCPAIEKNEDYKARDVESLYHNLKVAIGDKYPLGLLHGKLSSEEKDEVMNNFLNKKIKILVSTTVIEVGVDVKDANMMIIYDAHRFGMSQIHQLRGRVGRGQNQGYCYLLSDSKDKDALKRLDILGKSSDGFYIASEDLAIRGPGDLLGTKQSGIPGFILGDVIGDNNMLSSARDDATLILKNLDDYQKIKQYVLKNNLTSYLD